jgi:hypothetical protein
MGRFPQRKAEHGSQKWLQLAVNDPPNLLDGLLLRHLPGATTINWKSPLDGDEFAEYRDGAFLTRIKADEAAPALKAFWPARGPQWDALAITDKGHRLIVEAKAYVGELCSSPPQAGEASREKIDEALGKTARYLGATQQAAWGQFFYQLTNRLAHLYFLRQQKIDAWLVLVNFVGDTDMHGPTSAAEWQTAYEIVWHVLGLSKSHKLSQYVIEIYPDVVGLDAPPLFAEPLPESYPARTMAPRTTI